MAANVTSTTAACDHDYSTQLNIVALVLVLFAIFVVVLFFAVIKEVRAVNNDVYRLVRALHTDSVTPIAADEIP